jgi:hypothetical protein
LANAAIAASRRRLVAVGRQSAQRDSPSLVRIVIIYNPATAPFFPLPNRVRGGERPVVILLLTRAKYFLPLIV